MHAWKVATFGLLPLWLASGCAGTLTSALDLSGADASVRVQDDLYRSVNGRWMRTVQIPANRQSHGTIDELTDRSDRRVREIAEALAGRWAPAGSVAQKVGDFYASFVDTQAIERAGFAPASALLAEIDGIGSPAALARWMGRMQGILETPVLLSVGADYKNPNVYLAKTWQGGLGLPDRDYYLKSDDEGFAPARAAYETYLRTLARLAGMRDAASVAIKVIGIEERIAQAHWERVDTRDSVKVYNPMSVADLERVAPGIEWRTLLQAAGLGTIERLSVSQPSAVTAAAGLFAALPLDDWKQYFALHALDRFAPVLPKAFRDAHFAFHDKALGGTTVDRARWQQGVGALNDALGEAVGELYVAKYFPPANKARMQAMVATFLATFKASIEGLDWMTPATKARALDKLAKLRVQVGYPDTWRDYSQLEVRARDPLGNVLRAARFEWQRKAARAGKPVDRNEWPWWMGPTIVNASYEPTRNDIIFPAAILEPPFFDVAADDAVNYGGIGWCIGHEISHGFDDQGRLFDGEGALRDWWTDADRQAFDAIAAKLVAQYDAYEPLPGRHLNGKLTLDENIADLSGSQIAFEAYRRSLGGQPSPVVDGLPGEQRFFLSWARAWREEWRPEVLLRSLTNDPHAPSNYRINGPAINHDGFHQAFGTRPGDKLYKTPAERIRIW